MQNRQNSNANKIRMKLTSEINNDSSIWFHCWYFRQQLELNSGEQILLCTKYCQVLGSSVTEETKPLPCVEKKMETVTVKAKWNCPCVQGKSSSRHVCTVGFENNFIWICICTKSDHFKLTLINCFQILNWILLWLYIL